MIQLRRLASRCARLGLKIGATPRPRYDIEVGGIRHQLHLKLEGHNAFGSIKDRVALAILAPHLSGPRTAGDLSVLDASSGNYGAALAGLGRHIGFRVTVVAPRKISEHNRAAILNCGAELVVREHDYTDHARDLAKSRTAIFLDQYNNPANPMAHRTWTAPEALAGLLDVDAVFVAASSGGTARGFQDHLAERFPRTRLVVVDSPRSAVLSAATDSSAPPQIPGFGSSRPSTFAMPARTEVVRISEDTAYGLRALSLAQGVLPPIGLSAFGLLGGAISWLERQPTSRCVLLICADGADKYGLEARRFADQRPAPSPPPPALVTALRSAKAAPAPATEGP